MLNGPNDEVFLRSVPPLAHSQLRYESSDGAVKPCWVPNQGLANQAVELSADGMPEL